jgi:hypothetical protein
MSNYSDADRKAFEAKDRLNAYQSALKAATTNNEGLGKNPEDILTEAKLYYNELIGIKDGTDKCKCTGQCSNEVAVARLEEPKVKDYPVPEPNELDVLILVAKDLTGKCPDGMVVDFDNVCQEVNNVFGKYPHKKESVAKIVKNININNVLIKENKYVGTD